MWSKCLIVIALAAALAVAGCHKRPPVAANPPGSTPTVTAPPVPPPPAVPSPAAVLDDANSALASGNYDEAARGYESYLLVDPPGPKRDEALFHLGLTLALRPSPTGDWKRAVATFNQLVVEYPNSPFKPSASLILSLRAELERGIADARQREQRIKQLTTELDRLTKIDAERRKRP